MERRQRQLNAHEQNNQEQCNDEKEPLLQKEPPLENQDSLGKASSSHTSYASVDSKAETVFTNAGVFHQLWYLLKEFLILIPILFFGSILLTSMRAIQTQIVFLELGGNISDNANDSSQCKNSSGVSSEHSAKGDAIQREATRYLMYMEIGSSLAGLVFVPFWANFSDVHGRHYQLIAAMAGAAIKAAAFAIILMTHAPVWLLLVADTIHGMFGKSTQTLVLAAAAYCSDFTPYGSRTVTMFAIDTIITAASAIGSLATGYWVKASGYVPYLWGVTIMQSLVIVYILVVFRRFAKPMPVRRQNQGENASFLKMTKSFFLGTFHTVFKARHPKQYIRILLILLTVLSLFYHIAFYSSHAILGTYLLGFPLCWGPVLLGYFNAFVVACEGILPMAFALIFFRQGPSAWLILTGLVCGGTCFILYGLATTSALMFVAAFIGSSRLLASGVIRSVMVDYVEPSEQASVLGAYGVTSVASEMISSVAFVNLYAATVGWCRGFVFYIAAGVYGVAIMVLGVFALVRYRCKKSDVQLRSM